MTRSRHPNKEIEKALQFAAGKGWRIKESIGGSAHAWGRMYCPLKTRDGCIVSVWCTPRVPENHAKQLLQAVNRCSHST